MIRRTRYASRPIGVNMTPMIDVVFLLIIFFMVVSQVVSSETQQIDLPKPDASQARDFAGQRKTTVTLIGDGTGTIAQRKVGPDIVADNAEMIARLMHAERTAAITGQVVHVVLRADRTIAFRHVRQIIAGIAQANLTLMDIAAEADVGPTPDESTETR